MKEYRPLKDISIFVNTYNSDFIVAKHTSHANVKVSFGYSEVFTYVSNYQSSSYDSSDRVFVYLDALINKYEQLRDKKHSDSIDWEAIYQDTIDRLESLRAKKWHYLGHRG